MENASLKSRLLELLRRARADEQALISSLTADEKAATGTPERWSAKDLLAHIAYWRERLTQRLAARARGESFSGLSDSEVDAENATVFEAHRELSWEHVQADAARVFDQLVALVSQFGEEELSDPTPVGWYDYRALLAAIVGNSFTHPETHIAGFYLERGDLARARQLQENMADAIVRIDSSPKARGAALYNLACFYALNGESAKAIELLRQALPLRADLVEWSKQDPDLVSLRELPEYQALYEK